MNSSDEFVVTTPYADHQNSAVIQVPSATGSGTKRSLHCAFHGMQGKRLLLEATEPLAISTAVSVEHEDALFLGEIIVCAGASPGSWKLEIKVEQILTGLQNLMALRSSLLGEAIPKQFKMLPLGVLN